MQACIPDWPKVLRVVLKRGLTQREIGVAVGVKQSTISRLLSGSSRDLKGREALKLLHLAGARIELPEELRAANDGEARDAA